MRVDDELAATATAKLIQLQGASTDEAFAALLGCHRAHWWNVKRGRRRPSYALLKRAAAHFPELRLIVIRDWMDAPTKVAS